MHDQLIVSATSDDDIKKEAQYGTLHEKGFVRGDTAKHQWYLLVTDACVAAKVSVDEEVRDYLAVMLERFTRRAELFEQFAAFDFYRHSLGVATIDAPCVQDVADISLQYVAFFPERSSFRHEPRSLEYVANIGTSLYQDLARKSVGKDDWFSRAFQSMANSFGRAVMVLRSTRPGFAFAQEPAARGVREGAVPFLGITDAMTLGPALSNFSRMYLRNDETEGRHDN